MKDVLGKELAVGDKVAYCPAGNPGNTLVAGSVYEIDKIIEISLAVTVKGHLEVIPNAHVLKLVDFDFPDEKDKYEAQADKIIALINSKPWSPRKEEIIAVLKDNSSF